MIKKVNFDVIYIVIQLYVSICIIFEVIIIKVKYFY